MTVLFFLAPAAVAALLAFALTPVARRVAIAAGAVDQPGPRKIHTTPTPRLGGAAVVGAFMLVLGAVYAVAPPHTYVLAADLVIAALIGVMPILLISIVDDIRPLPAMLKLIVHLGGASAAVALGIRLNADVHFLGREVHIGWIAIPISVLWLAGTANAFNIVDGLDGLSAGLALISCVSLVAVSVVTRKFEMAATAAVLAGAIVGFLPFNIYPAKIYLGDTGATCIGFFLGALTLSGGATMSAGLAVTLPIVVLGVPIAETIVSIMRRVVRRLEGGKSGVMEADRSHFHHRLLDLGLQHKNAVLTLYAIGVLLAICGFASVFMNAQDAALLMVGLFVAAAVGVSKLGYDEFAILRRGAVLRFYETPVLRRSFFAVFTDLALVAAGLYGANVLKYDDWGLHHDRDALVALLAVLAPVTIGIFALLGTYRRAWNQANVEDLVRMTFAICVASVTGGVAAHLILHATVPATLLAVYTFIMLAMVNGMRASYRVLYHWNRKSNSAGQRVLIYGAGIAGALAVREMLTNAEMQMTPVGFIDDDPSKTGRLVNGYRVFGSITDLATVMDRNLASAVVVASHKIPIAKVQQAQDICKSKGRTVHRFDMSVRELTVDYMVPEQNAS